MEQLLNRPNYEDSSIVNLMASLAEAVCSPTTSKLYNPTPLLPPESLQTSKNVLLMIVDGLGYNFLIQHGQSSFLHQHLEGKVSSVFPTSTAPAITTFATHLAPQQHGILGWFTFFKELGVVASTLPLQARGSGYNIVHRDDMLTALYDFKTPEYGNTSCYLITNEAIANSSYNQIAFQNFRRIGYSDLEECFTRAQEVLASDSKESKYIILYWPGFDQVSHAYGAETKEAKSHFRTVDQLIERFSKTLPKGSTFVITADHGHISTTPKRTHFLKDHPELQACLRLPLSGEPRISYCYVKPDRVNQFCEYVENELSEYVTLHHVNTLVQEGFFGMGETHPKFFDRCGDYVLITRENYIFTDRVLGEQPLDMTGVHGGLSQEELFVPVCIVER